MLKILFFLLEADLRIGTLLDAVWSPNRVQLDLSRAVEVEGSAEGEAEGSAP